MPASIPSESAGRGAKSKKQESEWIDIKRFTLQVAEASKAKPLPNYVLQGPKGGSSIGRGRGGAGAGNPLGAFEAERKYKKNLEALKHEIEEKNREIDGLRREVKDDKERYKRLELQSEVIEKQLLDVHSKPPRET